MTEPLLAWTRPLTSAERDADIWSDFTGIDGLEFTTAPPLWNGWCPVLPGDVPQCPICTLPTRQGRRCAGCQKLCEIHGRPIDTLEFLAITNKREGPERLMWDWKENTALVDGVWRPRYSCLGMVADALSEYLHAHAHQLLAGDPIQTAVPSLGSRAPVIAAVSALAASDGKPSLDLTETGSKVGDWLQHKMSGQAQRLERTRHDWRVCEHTVADRPVVLVDDLFVTGASMSSYAQALRDAGATEIRAIAIGRHIAANYANYGDALRIVRRTREFGWSPERARRVRVRRG